MKTADDTSDEEPADDTLAYSPIVLELGATHRLASSDEVADLTDETKLPEARGLTGESERTASVVDNSDQLRADVLAADIADIDDLEGVDEIADIDDLEGVDEIADIDGLEGADEIADIDDLEEVDEIADIDDLEEVDEVIFQTMDERPVADNVDANPVADSVDVNMVEMWPSNQAELVEVEAMDYAKDVTPEDLKNREATQVLIEDSVESKLDLNTFDQLPAVQYQDLHNNIPESEEQQAPSSLESSEEAETTTIAGIEDQATTTEFALDQSGTTLVEPDVDQRIEPLTEHEESKPNEVGMPTDDAATTEEINSLDNLQEKTSTFPGSLERDDGIKLNEQIEGGVPEGYEGHHLIGINEAKDSIALQEAVKAGYNINNKHNGIALPSELEEAEKTGLPLHSGRHLGEYTNHVSKWLEILDEEYIRSQEVGKPWSEEQLLERVSLVEDAIRDEILLHKVGLQTKDPHKKL
jgi:hypothetical protein